MLTGDQGQSYLQVREEDCVGCNLCAIVCPVDGAISMIEVSGTDAPMTWNERQEAVAKLSEGKDTTKKEAV